MRYEILTFERYADLHDEAANILLSRTHELGKSLLDVLWAKKEIPLTVSSPIELVRVASDLALVSLDIYPLFKNEDEPDLLTEFELAKTLEIIGDNFSGMNPYESAISINDELIRDGLIVRGRAQSLPAFVDPSSLITMSLRPDLITHR